MFENIGTTELIIIALVILIFFGGSKLKNVARDLGESSKEIKKAKKEFEHAVVDIKNPAAEEDLRLDDAPEKTAKSVRRTKSKRKEG